MVEVWKADKPAEFANQMPALRGLHDGALRIVECREWRNARQLRDGFSLLGAAGMSMAGNGEIGFNPYGRNFCLGRKASRKLFALILRKKDAVEMLMD